MLNEINKLLREACLALNKTGCLNYQVNIKLFDCGNAGGLSASKVVKIALGQEATIGNTFATSDNEIIQDLKKGFEYSGDESSHPNKDALMSPIEQAKRDKAISLIKNHLNKSTMLIGFWLKEGHPFYPVFWDFAYIIEHDKKSSILIGSSSD